MGAKRGYRRLSTDLPTHPPPPDHPKLADAARPLITTDGKERSPLHLTIPPRPPPPLGFRGRPLTTPHPAGITTESSTHPHPPPKPRNGRPAVRGSPAVPPHGLRAGTRLPSGPGGKGGTGAPGNPRLLPTGCRPGPGRVRAERSGGSPRCRLLESPGSPRRGCRPSPRLTDGSCRRGLALPRLPLSHTWVPPRQGRAGPCRAASPSHPGRCPGGGRRC